MGEELPSVSIILLMKNHRRYMERSFDVIEAQDYGAPREYVYVDSGSSDGTIEFMRERGVEAHCIPPEEFHHGRTRNLAASLARHDVLVFLSADAIPADDRWLRNLAAPFQDPRVWGVYGKQIPPEGTGPLREYAMRYLYHDTREVRDLRTAKRLSLALIRFSNANSAIARRFWEKQPFNETVAVAEDHGMCHAILTSGGKVIYEPEAAVIHGHERGLWGEFCYAFENGISLKRMGILGNPDLGSEFKYGIERIVKEFQHFVGRGMYCTAVTGFVVSVAKFCGLQLGKRGDHLPRCVANRISLMVVKARDQP